MKGPDDPVDHSRTTRPHAGESMKDNRNMPALALIGLGVVLFVACLVGFATGNTGAGVLLAVVAAVALVAGGAWLAITHLRVRRIEERWYAEHPEVIRQEPNS
ncbi:UsfY protein [Mycobacterium vulneris]|uniref:protein UsfY n=1 Tax=Mycolicibacterium porcinum TaxID=39693 RepID=UPI00080AE35A|nr:protein UsfY [Mycolicibacterium porcinum]OCB52850.1 UsfY protein [Mycolicibacterium vulneris]OCB12334.1 UsfY protein [Mycolicibacterium porcinum]OCB64521.1 UsfY protein [Mycolicibacterium vulneris]ODR18484.1 UsfY protein [Mycolicibacterium porcinum]TVY06095.1 LapA family protein [Mycolicibacterium porcinum]